jgi:hypothetical protein
MEKSGEHMKKQISNEKSMDATVVLSVHLQPLRTLASVPTIHVMGPGCIVSTLAPCLRCHIGYHLRLYKDSFAMLAR